LLSETRSDFFATVVVVTRCQASVPHRIRSDLVLPISERYNVTPSQVCTSICASCCEDWRPISLLHIASVIGNKQSPRSICMVNCMELRGHCAFASHIVPTITDDVIPTPKSLYMIRKNWRKASCPNYHLCGGAFLVYSRILLPSNIPLLAKFTCSLRLSDIRLTQKWPITQFSIREISIRVTTSSYFCIFDLKQMKVKQ
jgi:hypothetical protein